MDCCVLQIDDHSYSRVTNSQRLLHPQWLTTEPVESSPLQSVACVNRTLTLPIDLNLYEGIDVTSFSYMHGCPFWRAKGWVILIFEWLIALWGTRSFFSHTSPTFLFTDKWNFCILANNMKCHIMDSASKMSVKEHDNYNLHNFFLSALQLNP